MRRELRSHNVALYNDNVQLRAGNDAFRQENAGLANHNQRLHEYAQQVAAENQHLSQYRAIVDVQAEVGRLRSQANTVLGEAHQQAAGVLAGAHAQAQAINKINPRKEFFRVDLSTIRDEVQKLGIQAKWTMTAAAQQFRESQAIDRAIDQDPTALQAWLDRQLVLDPVSSEPDEDELSAP